MSRKFDKYIKDLAMQEKIGITEEFEKRTEQIISQLPVNNYVSIKHKPSRQYKWSLQIAYIAIVFIVLSSVSVFAFGYHKYKLTNGNAGHNHDYLSTETGNAQTVDEKAESNNISATLVDVKADEKNIYVTILLKTKDGSDLITNTENSVARIGSEGFEKAYFVVDNTNINFSRILRTDDCSNLSQGRYELCYDGSSVSIESLEGKDIELVLENYNYKVVVSQNLGITDVGTMLKNIKLADDNAFSKVGIYMKYANGTEFPSYTLNAGDEKIYFSQKYPGTYIDNIGVHEWGEANRKCLYVSIVPESDEVKQQIISEQNTIFHTSSICLFNKEIGKLYGGQQPYKKTSNGGYVVQKSMTDGTVKTVDVGGECVQPDDGRIVLFFDIEETSDITIDKLKNFEFKVRCPEETKTVNSKFNFTFNLDNVSRTISYDVNKIYSRNKATAIAKKVQISDSYIKIDGTGEAEFGWKSHGTIYLILSDGTKVDAGQKIGGGYDSKTGIFSLDAMLSTLVDADNVTGIELWGETIELK